MMTRYLSSAAAGLAVTTTLLWVMQYLVEIAEPVKSAPVPGGFLDWVTVKEDTPVETTSDKPRPIPGPAKVPARRPQIDPNGPVTSVGIKPVPTTPTGPTYRTGVPAFVDGALVNIVNVQPDYPVAAANQGIEGYVIVRFDVTATGTVENVTIEETSHRVFNKAAIRAALRARYKPQVVDGVPQRSSGLRKLYRFEMDRE